MEMNNTERARFYFLSEIYSFHWFMTKILKRKMFMWWSKVVILGAFSLPFLL